MQVHWTDCHDNRSTSVVVGEEQRTWQRDRLHRVSLSNHILQHYGLKIEDWSGSKYILRDKKGSSEIIQDLGSLWPAVEKMTGCTPNPLDPSFLKAMHDTQAGG